MVVMAEYLTPDRLSELKHLINQLHYGYLETEESPQKIDQRQKLEAYIKEYLCLVPSQHKFCFRETADVLHRSASYKTDFSGYRAALAWNALSMYAGNLLAQPWRKEYRTIRLYSGFYKHEIEANLVGAEIMLEVMGYKHVRDSVMVLEGPICPDRVANVSRDSLVAFVECQIIKSIWEELSSRFKVSWLEVLEFREKHICSPDQAVRAFTYRWHERNFQSSQPHQPPPAQIVQHPLSPPLASVAQPIYNTVPITSHVIDNYARYQPLVVHAPPQQSTIYGTNPYYGYGTYATAPVTNYPTIPHQRYTPQYAPTTYQPLITPKTPTYSTSNNGYCCSPQNGSSNFISSSGYTQQVQIPRAVQVPTGQLIELDSVTYQEHPKKSSSYNNNTELTIPSPKARDEGTGTFESWDYVFRNLESQGYNKDVGQRGDLLCPDSKNKTKRGTRSGEHKSMKISDVLQKMRLDDDNYDSRINVAHSSSYDNLSSHSSSNKGRNNYSVKTKSLPRESKTYEDKVIPTVSQTLDVKKSRSKTSSKNENARHKEMPKDEVDNKKVSSSSNNSSKWHCNACTFLNVPTKDICEMCGKSRISITSPMPPMAVGGSECPKCTLINEKNVKICDACGASLTNSPTYI